MCDSICVYIWMRSAFTHIRIFFFNKPVRRIIYKF